MGSNQSFFNLYNHGFVRVAFAIPEVRVADPAYNAEQAGALLEQASDQACALVVFPELGLSAYSCEDLFHQQPLLEGCGEALKTLVKASQGTPTMAVVGLPLRHGDLLYNCAAVFQEGRLLGVVPKTYLPNYREYYEARHFASGETAVGDTIELCGQHDVPFGSRLLFQASDAPLLRVHVEICEDLWTPVPPSSYAAMAGATVLTNLSASNITTGKDDYRRQLVANQSGRCMAAYVYCAAGFGESTTDLAWDGHGMIYENGTAVAESQRFAYHAQLVTAEVDLERLTQDRMRNNTFGQSVAHHRDALAGWRTVAFEARLPRDKPLLLERAYERFPYVPSDPAQRDVRCREVYEIQVQGLVKRLQAAGLQRAVIGVSGGLDSTQALLVCARAMDVLGLPRENVLAYYMPGFG
nr:NAD(+) synthase [Gammaproteobacteria bacterium]